MRIDFGFQITDASIEKLKFEEENREASKYYETVIGKNWIEKIRKRAFQIYEESPDSDLPF